MTSVDPNEHDKTAPIEQPAPASPALRPSAAPFSEPPPDSIDAGGSVAPVAIQSTMPASGLHDPPAPGVVRSASQQEVVFVPLAVNVGDGFKFGCGFFLALVVAMLIGFVLLAGLFVLTSLFGLNLPISR